MQRQRQRHSHKPRPQQVILRVIQLYPQRLHRRNLSRSFLLEDGELSRRPARQLDNAWGLRRRVEILRVRRQIPQHDDRRLKAPSLSPHGLTRALECHPNRIQMRLPLRGLDHMAVATVAGVRIRAGRALRLVKGHVRQHQKVTKVLLDLLWGEALLDDELQNRVARLLEVRAVALSDAGCLHRTDTVKQVAIHGKRLHVRIGIKRQHEAVERSRRR